MVVDDEQQKEGNISLEQFLTSSKYRNCWVDTPEFSIHLRRGYRKVPDDLLHRKFRDRRAGLEYAKTFEISNIYTRHGVLTGQGHFRALLKELRTELVNGIEHFDGIYIENVFEPRFQKFLILQGFVVLHAVQGFVQRSLYLDLHSV